MAKLFLFTQHTKAITPPFDTPFLDATTFDGIRVRFLGVEHYTHGRNLTIMKYQGSPLVVWVSDPQESKLGTIDFEVPADSLIAVIPRNTKPLKQSLQNGEGERILKEVRKAYPLLKSR